MENVTFVMSLVLIAPEQEPNPESERQVRTTSQGLGDLSNPRLLVPGSGPPAIPQAALQARNKLPYNSGLHRTVAGRDSGQQGMALLKRPASILSFSPPAPGLF